MSQQMRIHRLQGYLNASPEGIDAVYAWNFAGADGSGVKFIDIEKGWLLSHEAINANTLDCTGYNDWRSEEHGAGVLGIVMMRNAKQDIKGIVPAVTGSVVSEWRKPGLLNTADAITKATGYLDKGDVLLLQTQVHYREKRYPSEVDPANFRAIKIAVDKGIIVIEPAGNNQDRGLDLDDFQYNGRKILNRTGRYFKDSGSIMVAAACRDVPHNRMGYSNFGSRVDCYAWGERVLTAGSFPDSSGAAVNTYTSRFGGTSGAAAIVAGAAIAIQGILKADGHAPLKPEEMRRYLSYAEFGTASSDGEADKIGVMPDLRKILDALGMKKPSVTHHKKELNGSRVFNA